MAQAKMGDTVKVQYIGSLENGRIFGSSTPNEPFEFIIGQQSVLPAFEQAVIGMSVGETRKIEVPPEEGYGPFRKELVFSIPKAEMPAEIALEEGKVLRIRLSDGNYAFATIMQITEDKIILDGNDPLAGRTLFFEITLLDIA
ncbi:MAG TPA: peptidylprolyl isomerase [Deltaproteobacteria bacterium]|nr:MAG: peptidylprolyl isomerase [Deltaproteobacteria bacterium]HDM76045.1 peptidylprolyl isomerase [Deltaproteobacteria bacterium]